MVFEKILKIDENILLSSPKFAKQREYWVNTLTSDMEVTEIPVDGNVPAPESRGGIGKTGICFPEDLCRRLIKFSKNSDLSLYIFFLTIVKLLIYRYTGSRDISVVSPLYRLNVKRDTVNRYLLIRVPLDRDLPFIDLLLKTRKSLLDAYENQDYPFDNLMENIFGGVSFQPGTTLSQIFCSFENIHSKTSGSGLGTKLHFCFRREADLIEGNLLYDNSLFHKNYIIQLVNHFINLAENALKDIKQVVSNISFLSEVEKKRLLFDFNNGDAITAGYLGDKTIPQLFEEQVDKTPDAVVAVYQDQQLTYLGLNGKANQLASELRANGVTSDCIVGLMVDRSIEMIVGILGILKAGGAYLPINPAFPEKRITTMLNEANTPVLVTVNNAVKKFMFTKLQNLQSGDRSVSITAKRPMIKNLDRLPRANRSLVDYEKYNRYIGQSLVKHNIAMLGTRGCPYNCAFCHKIWPKTHEAHSAEYLFEEVKFYYKIGVKRFTFLDDVFNVNQKNSRRFLELIIENGLDLQLFLCLRGDILTEEYIDLMVRAGTVRIALALETASARLQELIGKKLNLQRFRQNVEYICQKYPNVILELNTIHGFPTETEAEAMMTLEFIKSFKWVHFPYVHVLKIYPNTEMEKLALENGISRQAIVDSSDLAYHELPDTLPFNKAFTLKYQAEFFNEYFISRERLLHVLPYQMKLLTEDEIIQKYNSYLPVDIKTFDDLLQFIDISKQELGTASCLGEEKVAIPDMNKKLSQYFPSLAPAANALKVLLLDLSQFFTHQSDNMLYDVVEPPLGLIYLMTVLKEQYGENINGKIAKSRIDFDSYGELKLLLEDFKPDLIGIRTLTFYRQFFHKTAANVRQWGIDVPIIVGGPYATSDYEAILQDSNIDLVVLGEGENTFCELIGKVIENKGKLPTKEVLKKVPGLAFLEQCSGSTDVAKSALRKVLLLDAMAVLPAESVPNPLPVNRPSNLAYVFFTSGSTGTPKGVLLEHRNVNNLVHGLRERIYHRYSDNELKVCLVSPFEFDASVKQVFTVLLSGYSLHIVPEDTRLDGFGLLEFYRRYRVDIVDGTPAHMRILSECLEQDVPPPQVKEFVIGGEALSTKLVKQFFTGFGHGGTSITNVYGPTECCDVTTSYTIISGDMKQRDCIPIGKPLVNMRTYILCSGGKLQPPGAPGELHIAGIGVGRGYLNNPDMTGEKFIPNTFTNDQSLTTSDKVYRTGDLVRWLPDGNIEFLGRLDNQVKIRGFRIELGEIESHLLRHKNIKETVVVARTAENGDCYLCAYIVPVMGTEKTFDSMELREYLSGKLPHYMVPSFFVHLDNIPLTRNGKIDKEALPIPDGEIRKQYIGPRNKIEEKLIEMYANVLEREKELIGIHSNFFEIGGHSLRSAILLAKIHKEFHVKMPLADFFKTPTVEALAHYISYSAEDKYLSIYPVEKKEYYSLSSAQKRMYFLQQLSMKSTAYNVPQVFKIQKDLEKKKLEDVFRKLIQRHESLRTSLEIIEDQPRQRVHEFHKIEFEIEDFDISSVEAADAKIKDIMKIFIRSFDLHYPPLLRVGFILTGRKENILMVDMHHVISDEISHYILMDDSMALSRGEELPPLRIQYKDYAEWQNCREQRNALKQQEEYWLTEFKGDMTHLNLATDFQRSNYQNIEGDYVISVIEKNDLGKIRGLERRENVTMFMIVLSLLNVLLFKLSGQEEINIGTVIMGRRHADLEKIVGMFVNTLVMKNFPSENITFREFLGNVKKRAMDAFANQDYQFEELVDKLVITRTGMRNPLFDVFLTFYSRDEKARYSELLVNQKQIDVNIQAKFDLGLVGMEYNNELALILFYRKCLFKKETVKRFIVYLEEIIASVMENNDIYLKDISISSDLGVATSGMVPADEIGFGF
ncbi:MAG: AMP-binding protein [Acidobacteriota bacterium]|nr:AMP-binding protein [Acidobacteriota bacterium]